MGEAQIADGDVVVEVEEGEDNAAPNIEPGPLLVAVSPHGGTVARSDDQLERELESVVAESAAQFFDAFGPVIEATLTAPDGETECLGVPIRSRNDFELVNLMGRSPLIAKWYAMHQVAQLLSKGNVTEVDDQALQAFDRHFDRLFSESGKALRGEE